MSLAIGFQPGVAMRIRPALISMLALGITAVFTPFAAQAHDGDALQTWQHFPTVAFETQQLGFRNARVTRDHPIPSAVLQRWPASAAQVVGLEALSVPGNPAFGRIATP
jgi:hypothetical protein